MNIRFAKLQRHIASAAAALALSTFFIGAAVGPALVQPAAVATVDTSTLA